MLKTFMAATAISALAATGALAQTTTPAPAEKPAATSPVDASKFIAAQKSDQWLATKFSGTDVLGPDNKKIGDVNDLVFGKDGRIEAVVVGVGGFLGIGQKDVALPMSAFEIVPASAVDTNTGASGAAPARATADDPNDVRLKIAMTKEQLQNAPSFERYKAPPARTTGSTGNMPARPQ